GAIKGNDGWPLELTNASLGGMRIQSIEQLELLHPLRIEQYEIETDSSGMGEWIGGPGSRFILRPLSDVVVITFGDGMANPPHGVRGGTAGGGGGMYVEDEANDTRRYLSVTSEFRMLSETDVLVGASSGGGGYGDPYHRDIDAVRRDTRDGMISREAAR